MKRVSIFILSTTLFLAACTSSNIPEQRSDDVVSGECPPIKRAVESDIDSTWKDPLSEEQWLRLLTGKMHPLNPTPLSTTQFIRLQLKVFHEQDVTNDGEPEIFIQGLLSPPVATLPDVWRYLWIVTCADDNFQTIYAEGMQEAYQQFELEVLPDSNGNSLPEVRLISTNTHLDTFIITSILEWDGRALHTIKHEIATPTPQQ